MGAMVWVSLFLVLVLFYSLEHGAKYELQQQTKKNGEANTLVTNSNRGFFFPPTIRR
jgi:hypothetical protein